MKAVILAGGLGTRLSEETTVKPKPMVEIGGMPILWHIMKTYSHYGVNDFIVCCGYKGHVIKDFFANYLVKTASITVDMVNNSLEVHNQISEPWRVTLVETGESTLTGGRLKRVREFVGDETFCFTYGDGVSNINISELIQFHKREGLMATLTAVQPPGRFGAIALGENETKISRFHEKPDGDGAWINGGYFVLEPRVFDLIEGDETTWEADPLKTLARENQLNAFKHRGFWHPMDTLRDKHYLESLVTSKDAPWMVW
ncbi:glucose-1-phosphate cytidylyltransferase [Microbulbifer elongatus]|uniref:glucose-1-phosphate cytidylyltransferase n=1 Tax=Microbulbifer elongatus TaxID=86173 RepID=UPI001CFEE2FD|nr:glucose-1-phosphate cytidylyltransferase [Microbulbifer elongatus]